MTGLPPSSTSGSAPFDPRLEALVASFLDRWRRGEHPTLTEYVEKEPELAERVREFFPAVLLLEEVQRGAAGGERSAAAGDAEELGEAARIGEFRILHEIGRGGMGVVYETVQEPLHRRVALKVLPFRCLADGRLRERFRREAQAAASLRHPSIIPVYGAGEEGGVHYYAMQIVKGRGLDRVIGELRRIQGASAGEDSQATPPSDPLTTSVALGLLTGRFEGPEAVAVPSITVLAVAGTPGQPPSACSNRGPDYFRSVTRIGSRVAGALAHAHGKGVLHRDIKPSNLLVDGQGEVWVTDFGLAKFEGSDDLTHGGEILGTLRYMAPERFRGRSDPRSDVYDGTPDGTQVFKAADEGSFVMHSAECWDCGPGVRSIGPILGDRLFFCASHAGQFGLWALDLLPAGGLQRPGDANQDGGLDLSDAIWVLGHLFSGGPGTRWLPCEGGTASSPGPGDLALVDVNGDGTIDLSDPISVLSFLFLGSRPPALGKDCIPILGCPDQCPR